MTTIINNIDRLHNADNAGGAPWFQVVLPADIDTIPDRILDQIGSAITLNSGANAYNIMATTGTVRWTEAPQQINGRQVYTSVFSFVIPKDRADVLNYAQHLNNRGVVAIVRDANGQSRLMGTKDEPATFRMANRTLGGTESGRNEHLYEIVLTSRQPVPFYQVTSHLPAPANVCQPVPLMAVAASDSTPDFGDTITLTATPTNFTPTTYHFITVNNTGMQETTSQAGNTFNYVCAYDGSVKLTVWAEDGAGNKAVNSVTITVADLYTKHGIEHAWRAVDSVLVSNEVDEIPDHVGTSDATAPSSTTRLKYVKDPTNSANGVVRSTRLDRLGTNISTLQDAITIASVYYNGSEEESINLNVPCIIGGSGANNLGSRYSMFIETVSNELRFVIANNAAGAAAVITVNPAPTGKTIFVFHFNGTSLRVIVNGTVYTATATGTLYSNASNFTLFNGGGGGVNQIGWKYPTSEVLMRLSDIGDAGADQLYADLVLKYPA